MQRMRWFHGVSVGVAIAGVLPGLGPAVVSAQGTATVFPNRPVAIIVPNPPGGGPDFISRLIAPKLAEAVKQNVVVDNRASANGIVGVEVGARAAPDGSVITFGNAGTHAINATLYKKLPYDPLRDFVAVSEIANAALVMVVHPSVPANSVKELMALAKRHPGKLNVAVAGATGEIAGNALMLQGGVKMQNVPYKGGGPATIAIISGETDLTLTNYTAVARHVDAGKLKILAVTTATRARQLPDVATVAENGLPGYDHQLWYGLFLPSKASPALVQGLAREVIRIVNLPEIRERLEATGHNVIASTPEQFADKQRREVGKFRKIIIESKMQQE